MEAAFIPEVNDELDTQNFEKFEEVWMFKHNSPALLSNISNTADLAGGLFLFFFALFIFDTTDRQATSSDKHQIWSLEEG